MVSGWECLFHAIRRILKTPCPLGHHVGRQHPLSVDCPWTVPRKLHRKTESRRETHSNPHEGLNVRELSKFEQIYPADNRVEFAAMYDRFWSCYRSDLRCLFDSKATVKAPVEEPVTKDAEQPREQSTDGEQGGARKTSRRKTGTSLGPVVDALGRLVEDVEPSPDSTATEKKEVTASSSLSFGSVVSLALSSQRKAGSSGNRK